MTEDPGSIPGGSTLGPRPARQVGGFLVGEGTCGTTKRPRPGRSEGVLWNGVELLHAGEDVRESLEDMGIVLDGVPQPLIEHEDLFT